jgi:hypothetical protein
LSCIYQRIISSASKMPDDDRSSTNPFIRLKTEIDTQVARFWHGPRREAQDLSNSSPDRYNESSSSVDHLPATAEVNNPPVDIVAAQVQQQRISSWLAFSAYSPDNLCFLPQPVPKDLLHDPLAQSCSTFHDAFEDLLLVCSGRPLRDIRQSLPAHGSGQYTTSLLSLVIQAFSSQPWQTSLQEQGLWDAYFSRQQAHLDAESILEKASDLRRQQLLQQQQRGHCHEKPSETLLQSLIRQASMCEEEFKLSRLVGQLSPAKWIDSGPHVLWAALQDLDQMNDPWLKKVRSTGTCHEDPLDKAASEKAGTEEELYQAFCPPRSSGSSSPVLPWDSTAVVPPFCASSFDSATEASSHATETDTVILPDGSRTVTRVERRTHDGITEQSITTEKQDAHGFVTERTTNTMRFPRNRSGQPRE